MPSQAQSSSFYEDCRPYDNECNNRNANKLYGGIAAGMIGLAILGAMTSSGKSSQSQAAQTPEKDDTYQKTQRAIRNTELILKFLE